MIKRSIYCNENGMSIEQGMIVNGILIVLSIIIGSFRIEKFDIIKKGG